MTARRRMELEQSSTQSKLYNIAKVDLDIAPPDEWLKDWIETRKEILSYFGLEAVKIRIASTKRGLHFWFHLDRGVDFETLMKLQFLLGDDHSRVYFSRQRLGFKRFRDKFNILFSEKIEVGKDGKVAVDTPRDQR